MTIESPQLSRVRDARAGLLLTHPFFGVLSLKVKLEECTAIPTCAVNTTTLKFNPAFVDKLDNAELKGVIAHEVMHLAMCHHARQGSRDHKRWNMAADYAINPELVADGFALPKGGLNDPQYAGLSAEVIYDRLRDEESGGKPQRGDGEESTGTFESAGPEDSAEAGEAERDWTANANDAARAAASAGKLPAHVKRMIAEATAPKADWKSLTRRWMQDQVRARSTWSKRNKRFPDVYLPGRVADGLGELALFIDSSGSTWGVLDRFGAAMREIIADLAPSAVHLAYCDAAINRSETYENGEEFTLEAIGGGGTDFRPPFALAESENWNLAGAIYLTDLCGPFPEHAPGYPVLWVSIGAGGVKAPWGETVAID